MAESKQEHQPWHKSYQKSLEEVPSWSRHGMPFLFGEFIRKVVAGGKHLDIGCGDGVKLINYAKEGLDTTGVDISSMGFENAERLISGQNLTSRCRVIQADCLNLPFEDQSFHCASDVLVFTHIKRKDQKKYKEELKRVLKKGGYVLMVLFSDKDEHFHGHKVSKDYIFEFDSSNPLMKGFEHYQGMVNIHFGEEDIKDIFGDGFKVIDTKEVAHPVYNHRFLWNVILQNV